jgi:hypothetical protein
MCGGFSYTYKDPAFGEVKVRKVFFPIPHAQIPILDGREVKMVQWGKRQGEDPEFVVPVTGWARLNSLVEGKWNHYQPKRVRIPALTWMEKDPEKNSHWFEMEPDRYLLGVKIDKSERSFVYIVTREATGEFLKIHSREPMIVGPDVPTMN